MPRDLPLSNGSLLVAFDATYAIRELTWPRVGQENHAMGRRSRVALRADGITRWLGGEGWAGELRYERDTLATHVDLTCEELRLRVVAQDVVDPELPLLLRRLTVRNLSGERRSVTLLAHHDLDILEGDAQVGVLYDPATGSLLHHKRRRWFLMGAALDGRPGWQGWSCDARSVRDGRGTAGKVEDGEVLDGNPVSIGAVDTAGSVELDLLPNASLVVYLWLAAGETERSVTRLQQRLLKDGLDHTFDIAREEPRRWSKRLDERLRDVPEPTRELARRSLLIIRTQADRGGAIMAANDSDTLDPGRESYAYLWPRDGALVAAALDRAGFHEIPRRFFALLPRLLSRDGTLAHRYRADGSVGSSWLPRVQDGRPSTSIQQDETSLALWALGGHDRLSGDAGFVASLIDGFVIPAARFLATWRDPLTGLPHPSWDLWEERLGVHTFTAASVACALREAARIVERSGDTRALAPQWREAAAEIDAGIHRYLYHEDLGRYARTGYPQDGGYHLDTTVDASLLGLVTLSWSDDEPSRIDATVDAVERHLAVNTPVGGIARYEDDPFLRGAPAPGVPGNPWILCTLWLAEARLTRALSRADLDAAAGALDWARQHARPSGVLPEQLDPTLGTPVGVSPLTWSHAAYLAAACRLQESLAQLEARSAAAFPAP